MNSENNDENNGENNGENNNVILVILLIFIIILINTVKKNKDTILNFLNFSIKNKSNLVFNIIVGFILLLINLLFNNHTIVNIIIGLLFGFRVGIILAFIIQSLSITIVFYFSKYLVNDKIKQISKNYNVDDYVKNDSIYSIIISRLLPLPVNIVTLLWGTKDISYSKVLVGSLIGLFPWTIFELYTGTLTRSNKKYIIDKLPEGLYILLFIVIYIIFRNIYKIHFINDETRNN